VLNAASGPFCLSGDVRVDCSLIDGSVDDLNVMTRRSRFQHRVSRCPVGSSTQIRWKADTAVIIVFGDAINIELGSRSIALAGRDCMELDPDDPGHFTASSPGRAELYLVEIWRVEAAAHRAPK
jgi:hypothetical protein